jgi:hypothetical protein
MKGVVLGRRFFGYGVKHFQSTSVRYEGLFIDGKPDLRGRFEFPSGDVYEGQISDQLPGPQGIIRFHDGTVYEGAFSENGVVSGPGYFTTPDGETVECTVFRPRTIHLTADGMLDQNGFMVDGVWYGEPPLLQKHQLQSLEHDESSLNNRMAVHLLLTADGKRVDFAQKSRKLAISWCFDT